MIKYGVENAMQVKEVVDKIISTKKKNKTFNSSMPEEKYYEYLITRYGEDDIVRQYSDDRYPFCCDFYIKSIDTFIELNLSPFHRDHAFNANDPEDILLLEKLKKSNTNWDKAILDAWGNRDIKKLEIAKLNNLNYIVIYKWNYKLNCPLESNI